MRKRGASRWDRLNEGGIIALPRETLLLGELTKQYKTIPVRIFRSNQSSSFLLQNSKRPHETPVLRIVDAAMLAGDDISGLHFDKRMAAIEKFCNALRVVGGNVNIVRIEPATYWSADRIDDMLER